MVYKYFFVIFLIGLSAQVFAWDGAVSGKVYAIDVTGGENYGFRISLDGGTKALCGNQHKWAYINESTSNYQTYVGVLLAAQLARKTVTVYSNQNGTQGYCKIGYINMR